jgi:ribosomal protein L30/L7E
LFLQRLKLTREFISSFLKETIPEYEEALAFIEQSGGWISVPPKIAELVHRFKVHARAC